jgi:hypothetical protein
MCHSRILRHDGATLVQRVCLNISRVFRARGRCTVWQSEDVDRCDLMNQASVEGNIQSAVAGDEMRGRTAYRTLLVVGLCCFVDTRTR